MGRLLLVLILVGAGILGLPELKKRMHPKVAKVVKTDKGDKAKIVLKDKARKGKGKKEVAAATVAMAAKNPGQPAAAKAAAVAAVGNSVPAEKVAALPIPEKTEDTSSFEDLSEDLK